MDELLDLFDAQGKPAGVTIRRGEEAPQGLYWAIVDVWIINSRGEILIQQRDRTRPNWPGYWCESAGGAIQSGETPDDAAVRETQEELGHTPCFDHGGKVFEFLDKRALRHVYLFREDVDPASLTLQPGEVCDAKYVPPDGLRAMLRRDEFVPISYIPQLLTMLPILISMYRKAE